ncbi:MAG: hypothetical protein ABI705_11420 [Aestuariivirga sp.]
MPEDINISAKSKRVITTADPLIVGSSMYLIGRDGSILGKTHHPGNRGQT